MCKLQHREFVWMLMVSLCSGALAQSVDRSGGDKPARSNGGSQVEVKKDDFSGMTMITLKPQKLIDRPEHQLTISVEAKLRSDTPSTGFSEIDNRAQIKLVSHSSKSIDFGDEKLYFLVDGQRVNGPTAGGYDIPLPGAQPSSPMRIRHSYLSGLSLSHLSQIARGKKVEMRLGSVETILNSKMLSLLNEFVGYYQQQLIREGKP